MMIVDDFGGQGEKPNVCLFIKPKIFRRFWPKQPKEVETTLLKAVLKSWPFWKA